MTLLRKAGPDDAVALDAFLTQHPATSMFLRANLAAFGTDNRDHRHGTTYFVPEGTEITGVFAISNGGYLLAQAPDAPPEAWAAFAALIKGRTVAGMTGRPVQVAQCLKATGLLLGPWMVLADEPLYQLELSALPDLPADVRTPEPRDLALLENWYATYALDTGQSLAEDGPSEQARARAAAAIDSPDVVILEDAGTPVAMAGINARLPDTVQLGGVFTPDGMRGNGYARRAVAGLLRRCAAQGVTQSVLFANNAAAAHAYEALGFQHVGEYRVALLRTPQIVGDNDDAQ
ncbi:GNAT family N-acetyltransferase [uncultured Tateyamaria sp.]|uniref:GNAT family N-acetyltransferase n=1 Tax=uncultured Tateyamaria sp. TaxID=455651 RepID=UPI002636BD4B|nr:GNAT family N-acetyltransferase [uncultured Tateyamaria sp.]